MSQLMALSVSVAVLGAVWSWICLGLAPSYLLVWVGFIAAACFFGAGGDQKALVRTIVGMIYGAVVAWITLMIISKGPQFQGAMGPIWDAIVIGVLVFFLVIVASVDVLSCVPANVYGFAAVAGYTLAKGNMADLTAGSFANPLILVAVSAACGGVLGYAMGQGATMLKAK
ncbi:MAG TPA: DUF1097 domain-containing protein [Methylovirgula sp.]|nr:DUF1097 domain-containing protein [Methylovirgula sp.]